MLAQRKKSFLSMGVEEEIEFEVSLEGQVGQGMEHISDGRVSIYGFIHV